ncbi:hypothetical protein [Vibrio parahaemolyticus]|uniref:hypothetical protein n=1 Tax=Vibrio parahaemolyticus TaxID=670 RepID=UPI003D7CAADB
MSMLIDANPVDLKAVSEFVSNFKTRKAYVGIFNDGLDLSSVTSKFQSVEDMTSVYSNLPVEINKFINGFIFCNDFYLLFGKNRVIGNVAESESYSEMLKLLHLIREKSLKTEIN